MLSIVDSKKVAHLRKVSNYTQSIGLYRFFVKSNLFVKATLSRKRFHHNFVNLTHLVANLSTGLIGRILLRLQDNKNLFTSVHNLYSCSQGEEIQDMKGTQVHVDEQVLVNLLSI